MIFKRFAPATGLEKIIECYWIARDGSTLAQREKIIPDGFTEIIFHKAAPYRICMEDSWQLQSPILFAGQISRYFFLENTGSSDIIGIKLKPAAFTHLYQLPAWSYTNKVVEITGILPGFTALDQELDTTDDDEKKVRLMNAHFNKLPAVHNLQETAADRAVDIIFAQHGILQVADICRQIGIGGRQLENLFKINIGLSPKLFARIIRFSYIFQLLQENNQSWCSLAYEAAFYDQSHFIRNFKNFTGENPSDYAFDEKSMANFFLNKK
jgi:AraC-like DNA-binding protein